MTEEDRQQIREHHEKNFGDIKDRVDTAVAKVDNVSLGKFEKHRILTEWTAPINVAYPDGRKHEAVTTITIHPDVLFEKMYVIVNGKDFDRTKVVVDSSFEAEIETVLRRVKENAYSEYKAAQESKTTSLSFSDVPDGIQDSFVDIMDAKENPISISILLIRLSDQLADIEKPQRIKIAHTLFREAAKDGWWLPITEEGHIRQPRQSKNPEWLFHLLKYAHKKAQGIENKYSGPELEAIIAEQQKRMPKITKVLKEYLQGFAEGKYPSIEESQAFLDVVNEMVTMNPDYRAEIFPGLEHQFHGAPYNVEFDGGKFAIIK